MKDQLMAMFVGAGVALTLMAALLMASIKAKHKWLCRKGRKSINERVMWYHGTVEQSAIQIIAHGLRKGSWLAPNIEIAAKYGDVIIAFQLDKRLISDDAIDQIHTLVPIYPDRIVFVFRAFCPSDFSRIHGKGGSR